MHVIGTAGHVDHGKSTLVKALTGIDPDRLKEEKEREMTIDLGFAWLKLPSGEEISIVDVPGHERFVKNMLAGVGGIDLALLVVAADEGVMAQTKEHLAILDLLEVKKSIVVITKKDLVDAEWLELVKADIVAALKGTALSGAPLVAVSSMTGEGLPNLLTSIEAILKDTPAKRDIGRPRLPIDRAFVMTGFGTVVTGTLVDGRLELGQEVEVVPKGLTSRIRGLQTHRKGVDVAVPGSRVAVNVSGIPHEKLERGDVLATPGWLKPTTALDARFRLVPAAPAPMKHNAVVTLHIGTMETPAKVRLLDKAEIAPGESAWVQLRSERPVAAVKGDYFIVRSSWGTVGGGQVVESHSKRHRRFNAATLERLEVMQQGSPEELVLQALSGPVPVEAKTLVARTNLPWEQVKSALAGLIERKEVLPLTDKPLDSSPLLVSSVGYQLLSKNVTDAMRSYHAQFPLRKGMQKEELRSRLDLPASAFNLVLQRLRAEGVALEEGAHLRLPSHQPALSKEQERTVEAFLKLLSSNPYAPSTDVSLDPELLTYLLDRGILVRTSPDVIFTAEAYKEMVARVVEFARSKGKVTVAEVRDMFGTSRKYVLSLLEYMDQQKITRRVGDERVLR